MITLEIQRATEEFRDRKLDASQTRLAKKIWPGEFGESSDITYEDILTLALKEVEIINRDFVPLEDTGLGKFLPAEDITQYITNISNFKRLVEIVAQASETSFTKGAVDISELAAGKSVVEGIIRLLDEYERSSFKHLADLLRDIALDYSITDRLPKRDLNKITWATDTVRPNKKLNTTARTGQLSHSTHWTLYDEIKNIRYDITVKSADIDIKDAELGRVVWEAIETKFPEDIASSKDTIKLELSRSVPGTLILHYFAGGKEYKIPLDYSKVQTRSP